MEGGSKLLEYLTYGIIGVVLLALGVLAARSAWFFLSLLAIPLAESVGRWRPFRGMVTRWGERGARRDPALWAARLETDITGSAAPPRPRVPRAIRLGTRVGALAGALTGLWLGLRGAPSSNGVSAAPDAAWMVATGFALAVGAGIFVGAALGAGVGLTVAALRPEGDE